MTPSTATYAAGDVRVSVSIERRASLAAAGLGGRFAVGTVVGQEGRPGRPARVSLPLPESAGSDNEVLVDAERLVEVPDGLSDNAGLALLPVAAVLGLWDRLDLDLGEIAVVTGGSWLSHLAAVVAGWHGAFPVVCVRREDPRPAHGVRVIDATDPTSALASLREAIGTEPAAVLELSGSAETVDLVLEAVPPFSRVMLAGASRERLVLDFYTNVHRKGLTLLSTTSNLEALESADSGMRRQQLARAARLLMKPGRAEDCLAAL